MAHATGPRRLRWVKGHLGRVLPFPQRRDGGPGDVEMIQSRRAVFMTLRRRPFESGTQERPEREEAMISGSEQWGARSLRDSDFMMEGVVAAMKELQDRLPLRSSSSGPHATSADERIMPASSRSPNI